MALHPTNMCTEKPTTQPTIHGVLTVAMESLAQAENECRTIDNKLFGCKPEAKCDSAKCSGEPTVEQLAIGLRTRLGDLHQRLDQMNRQI